ncbi:ATPase AAA [Corynebacterium phocae]|uniref:ATPase AAA n=1 Tax=Corynebacterium phocae TaxID=161895 RepID=A0A1L7D190_9CORY|nr:IS21-like element helper ATPase IstB [Corynebacterium phocae]APT91802.1 ATPase AAA [Corynebacterium phocae]APT93479.1 ATPase AAA [Corynebacterium phocae]
MKLTNEEIIENGRQILLTRSVLSQQLQHATPKQREFLQQVFLAEIASRQANRRTRLLRKAKIPTLKHFNGYSWDNIELPPDITRDHITDLTFLNNHEDLVLFGDVGTGKTHLATAAVTAACAQGIPAQFFTTAGLVDHLRNAKTNGTLTRELKQLGKNELLVIDEFGYVPIDDDGARLVFQAISDAYEQRSLIITTNLPFTQWGQVFGNNDMAAAAIDRIVHYGRLLKFTGPSYRVAHALMK